MIWARHAARMRAVKYWILAGKCQDKRPLRRPSHAWEDNITMDLKEDGKMWAGFIWFWIKIMHTHFLLNNDDVMIL